MKILAIGNSFSRDATAYLHQLLQAGGVESTVVNLYVGGCSLERHWQNIEADRAEYQYQLNGQLLERYVSIRQALEEQDWDYIVTQQASHDSGWADTYEPFLSLLTAYLRRMAPRATLCLHQTWAYETDSSHGSFMRYRRDQALMHRRLTECYKAAAQRHGMLYIPCGAVIQALRETEAFCYPAGGISLCRDGFHMHLIYGRYALSCTWARRLARLALPENWFPVSECDPALPADGQLLSLIRRTVTEVCAKYEAKE